jgi:hypothetical protein
MGSPLIPRADAWTPGGAVARLIGSAYDGSRMTTHLHRLVTHVADV